MIRRLAQVVLVLIVALAATLPVATRAMAMPAVSNGTSIHRHCSSCPHRGQTDASPDKATSCQLMACAAAVAPLPSVAMLPESVWLRSAYLAAPPVRWASGARVPDPFPPRPIALV